jgi:hypothetical protein
MAIIGEKAVLIRWSLQRRVRGWRTLPCPRATSELIGGVQNTGREGNDQRFFRVGVRIGF